MNTVLQPDTTLKYFYGITKHKFWLKYQKHILVSVSDRRDNVNAFVQKVQISLSNSPDAQLDLISGFFS